MSVLRLAMSRLAIVFLFIVLVAAFLGSGEVAVYSGEGARPLIVVCIILALLSFLMHGLRQRPLWG